MNRNHARRVLNHQSGILLRNPNCVVQFHERGQAPMFAADPHKVPPGVELTSLITWALRVTRAEADEIVSQIAAAEAGRGNRVWVKVIELD